MSVLKQDSLIFTKATSPGKFIDGSTTNKYQMLGSWPLLPKRKYVGHDSANATNSWIIPWVAPDSSVGTVCFYAAGNAANGNNKSTGDSIYTTSLCIALDSSSGIVVQGTPLENSFEVQSLVYNRLNISY